MKGKEARSFGLSEITFQQPGLGPRQVHNDESVQCLTEMAIDIETDEFPAELEVLAKQHRNPGARRLDVSYGVRKIIDVARLRTYGRVAPERVSCRNESNQVGKSVPLLEE